MKVYGSLHVCKCASLQVCKCASLLECKYGSMQICKYANLQICQYVSMQICKYEICKYGYMQVPAHEVSSVEESGQSAPKLRGAGLLHCLDRSFFPVWVLHTPQEPQALHTPFTAKINDVFTSIIKLLIIMHII